MGIRVLQSSTLPDAARNLLETDPRSAIYQTPRWIKALGEAYPRLRFFYLVLEEDDKVTGFIPMAEVTPYGLREVVSMPFGTHGGPVLASHVTREGMRALILKFVEQLRGLRTFRFEMTVLDPAQVLREELEAALGRYLVPAVTWMMDLTQGPEVLWDNYDQRLRRNLRRAARSGITIREEEGSRGLDTFFDLYATQARTWPVGWHHSRAVLSIIVDALGNDARIWVASEGERDLCAQLVLYHAHREMHFWMSGAVPESRPVSAFHYLLHNIVQDASRKGYASCDFGSSMGDEGVDRFKRSFGASDRPLLRFYRRPRWLKWFQRIRW